MALSFGSRMLFAGFAANRTSLVGSTYQGVYSSSVLMNQFQSRDMATLKEVKNRIKSVTSIQKITKSMKLVATTRLKKAEEMFAANKPSLLRLDDFLMEMKGDAADGAEDVPAPTGDKKVVLCLTTERGLCGSVNRFFFFASHSLPLSLPPFFLSPFL